MKAIPILNQYLIERNQLLNEITKLLEHDPHVKATWLIGSLGRYTADALSDLDVWVIVDDDQIDKIKAQPYRVPSEVKNLVLFLEAPQNAPDGGAYLMAGYDAPVAPHLVDWYWQPLAFASSPDRSKLLFDHVGIAATDQPVRFSGQPAGCDLLELPNHYISFFWMMFFITAKNIARSPRSETKELLPHLMGPLEKARQFLGQDRSRISIDLPHQIPPAEKIRQLYQLVEEMSGLMAFFQSAARPCPPQSSLGLTVI